MQIKWLFVLPLCLLFGAGCFSSSDVTIDYTDPSTYENGMPIAYYNVWVESDGFDVTYMAVKPGQTVQIDFQWVDGFHTFVIDEFGFRTEIVEGQIVEFVAPDAPGTYRYYSDVDDAGTGFEGELVILE
ncbi:MAG: hypothetical protein WCT24_00620 [Patescibacteria group bacterium]|jgi:heme/copper-type cytochrome/quinol oxidase subunit 2